MPNTCAGYQNGALSGSISCTWSPSPPPAGSSLVCGGTTINTGSTVTGLSISDGTVFTPSLAARDANGNRWILLAYRFNIGVTAPATVTMTITGTDMSAIIVCNAFTDSLGIPTADGTCIFGTNSVVSSPVTCTSAIVTTGLDYIVGLCAQFTGNPIPSAGWAVGSTSSNLVGSAITVLEIQIQAVAGSITPSFTTTTGQYAGINGFAIKP